MLSFSFNGETKDYVTALKKKRPMRSARKHNILTVPGYPGGYHQDTDIEPLSIPVDIMIDAYDADDLRRKAEEIADWLDVKKASPLIFEDDPFRTYYALVEGELNPDEMVTYSTVSVLFLCPDPHKYGIDKIAKFSNDELTITNEGTEETPPKFTIKPLEDVTHVDVVTGDGDKYVRIGTPITVDDSPYVKKSREFWNEMNTLVGWANPASVENGTITGTMKTNGYRFFTDDFGTGTGWHGPAKKTSLSEPLYDFTLRAHIRNFVKNPDDIGRVDVCALDSSNNQIGKMMMAKYKTGTNQNQGRMQVGDAAEYERIIDTYGDKDSTWTHYDGIMELTRRGNGWGAYIAVIDDDGKHIARAYERWDDDNNAFLAPITQVQVYIAQHGSHPVTDMGVDDIKVYKWNDNIPENIPFSVGPDDEIVFDFADEDIRINGDSIFVKPERIEDERRMALFSEFFNLQPGINKLYTFPSGKLDTTLTFRERYK